MEQGATTQGPLSISKGVCRLVFENDRVGVLDIKVKPGGKAAMHSHPGYVAIALDKKEVEL